MLPVEATYAIFPKRAVEVRLGWRRRAVLHSVTLRHAALMEKLGCGLLNGGLTAGQALLAGWILTLDAEGVDRAARGDMSGARGFFKGLRGHVGRVCRAVAYLVEEASAPFVPPKDDGGAISIDGLPSGCGWPLEIAEALCAHYGWSFDAAMDTEVGRAFALIAVSRSRTGGEHGGPDYYGRIRLSRMKAAGVFAKGGLNG